AATALYAVLAVQLTWPVITDLNGTIFGAFGDLTGSMAYLRELVNGGHNPFLPGTIDTWSVPDGRDIEWPQNVASFVANGSLYLLAVPFGAVAAYSLFTLAGFVATGAVTFAFVRKLTGNPWIGLIAGWAYAFSPFAVMKGAGHVNFVHGWGFVLVLWRMLILYERPTLRSGLIAGVVTVVAMAVSPYHLLFAGLEWGALLAVGILVALARRRGDLGRQLRAQAACAGVVLVFAVALGAVATYSAQGTGVEERTLSAVTTYSARPLEYLVPHSTHPIWGEEAGEWRADRLHGSNFSETQLYVGWSLILLSLVALIAAARRRLDPRLTAAVVASATVGGVALVWSAPPEVLAFGELIPFPSKLTFEVNSAWRVYARLVMVVMLAVVVLASIGLERLVENRSRAVRAALIVAIAALIVLDLRATPLEPTKLGERPSLEHLDDLPEGVVANYPIEPSGFGDYSAEFNQGTHDQPILNGYEKDSLAEDRALLLDDLEDSRTPGRLAGLGVTYVIVDDVPVEAGTQDPGEPGRGLRFITDDGHHSIWRVTAAPEPLATFGPGFSPVEANPGGRRYRWLAAQDGQIELLAGCDFCRGTLSVDAESLLTPRRVSLVREDGTVLATRTVPAGERRRVSFLVRFRHRETVFVRTAPGPSLEPGGAPNARTLSVSMTAPRLELR
ncbi:MAG: hypothetical protein ACRDM7_04425, partial [Thermoleophilaceae bacterium]